MHSSAPVGTPRWPTDAITLGAWPCAERLRSSRTLAYRVAFTPEIAAVRTTKFMIPASAGMCSEDSAVTNGDCSPEYWSVGSSMDSTRMEPM